MNDPESRPLTQAEARDALDALNNQLTQYEREIQVLQVQAATNLHAKVGRALMPPGSKREKFFMSMLAKVRPGRAAAQAELPQHAAEAPEVTAQRVGLVRSVLKQATTAIPVERQYKWSLDTGRMGARNPGPNYVPFEPATGTAEQAVRLIAFYLPQFHPIPENDSEWGKGFTEWTNVTRAVSQYLGQYQPHLPEDVGFYDLRVRETQDRQVQLAKEYGFAGFAFYYYWFGGKRLLEKPFENFIANPKIDFPFCLIWANENWTRRWDGQEDDIFVAQVHTPESDIEFLKHIEPYLKHPNYIRIDGRPVLIVYKCQLLPDAAETAKRWREYAQQAGLGGLYLIASQTMGFTDPTEAGFDAAMQFPPHNEHMDPSLRIPYWQGAGPDVLNPEFKGDIFSVPGMVSRKLADPPDRPYKLFETAFPMWDNTARRPSTGWIYAYSNPELYRLWLTRLCMTASERKEPSERVVFVNAWNEWAEGAHLEPDRRYGYGFLAASRDALAITNSIRRGREPADIVGLKPHDKLEFALGSLPGKPLIILDTGASGVDTLHSAVSKLPVGRVPQLIGTLSDHDARAMEALRTLPDPSDAIHDIERGRAVRKWLDSHASEGWDTIVVIEEPVARNINSFLTNAKSWFPNLQARLEANDLFADEFQECLMKLCPSDESERLLESQLAPCVGIDLLQTPFDHERGYIIVSSGQNRVLAIRSENLSSRLKPALQEFFELGDIELDMDGNPAIDPKLVALFLEKSLTKKYVESQLAGRYATHFYTPDELKRIARRWN